MNIIKLFILTLVSVLLACSSNERWADLPKPAPNTRVTLLDGSYVPLQEYRGKIIMLSFWAAWCSASKSLITNMNELASEISNDRVVFLAVSIDKASDQDKLENMIAHLPLNKLQHAFSGNEGYDEAFNAFGCVDVPQLFIIDELGNVVSHSRSASDAEEYLEGRGIIED